MASAAIDWDAIKLAVVHELEDRALRPTDLLSRLSEHYPDTVIKEAVLRMLQERSIKMTPDQQLELTQKAA